MALFPITPVLTTFAGADENPLSEGGNWPANVDTDNSDLRLLGNQVTGVAAAVNSMYWTTTFGPDSEVFATVPTLPAATDKSVVLYVRIADGGTATPDGYLCVFVNGAAVDLMITYRMDDGAFTQLGAADVITLTPGDVLGARVTGNVIQGYQNGEPVGSGRVDSTYTAAGKIGLGCTDTTVRISNFGGGTVTMTPLALLRSHARTQRKGLRLR